MGKLFWTCDFSCMNIPAFALSVEEATHGVGRYPMMIDVVVVVYL